MGWTTSTRFFQRLNEICQVSPHPNLPFGKTITCSPGGKKHSNHCFFVLQWFLSRLFLCSFNKNILAFDAFDLPLKALAPAAERVVLVAVQRRNWLIAAQEAFMMKVPPKHQPVIIAARIIWLPTANSLVCYFGKHQVTQTLSARKTEGWFDIWKVFMFIIINNNNNIIINNNNNNITIIIIIIISSNQKISPKPRPNVLTSAFRVLKRYKLTKLAKIFVYLLYFRVFGFFFQNLTVHPKKKLTAGTWTYTQKEKEKHRPKPPILGFQMLVFRGLQLSKKTH